MKKILTILGLFLFVGFGFVPAVQAGWFAKCESKGDYKPPRGVYKVFSRRVKTEWEHRQHCLPCGRRIPYKVKVITYRDRYSNGISRTWKCVVAGSEVSLGK